MSDQEVGPRVQQLGNRVMEKKSQGKDSWDRITALATIMIPAAIALAGHFISQGLKHAEIASEEMRAEQSRILAESNIRVAQAGVINTLMKSLTSPNSRERKLAIDAVLIALPEQGAALVRTVAETDADKTVQDAARTSLEHRAGNLIHELFSDAANVRINAAKEIVKSWRADPSMIAGLVQFAEQNKDNVDGIYNTVVVLGEFNPASLEVHKEQVLKFLNFAKTIGEKTKAKATALERQLSG